MQQHSQIEIEPKAELPRDLYGTVPNLEPDERNISILALATTNSYLEVHSTIMIIPKSSTWYGFNYAARWAKKAYFYTLTTTTNNV